MMMIESLCMQLNRHGDAMIVCDDDDDDDDDEDDDDDDDDGADDDDDDDEGTLEPSAHTRACC
jgi:hypothetical protein